MRNTLILIGTAVTSLVAGYWLGWAHEQSLVWKLDQKLVQDWGVAPAELPEFSAAEENRDSESAGIRFEQWQNSGITFAYANGPPGQFHLAETVGGGVGALDFDSDGFCDLLFVDGGDPITWPDHSQPRTALYRSVGGNGWSLVSEHNAPQWTGYGHGCAVADVNNDGFDDVLVTGYQQSALFINLGDGTFDEDQAFRSLTGEQWCATACWNDLDGDGDLDLYIACYADTPRTLPTPVCQASDVRIHCNPRSYRGVSDLMFENLGDGRFADRSSSSGISAYREYGMGVIATDLNGDGVPEIFVANDGDRNLLFQKTADWQYQDIALTSGVAFNGRGESMGSMGIACADFDSNGRLDLLTTNFSYESNALFHQVGDLAFVENAQGTIIDRSSRPLVGWSAIPLDGDCDGFPDLFVANGHVTQMPQEDWAQHPSLLKGGADGFKAVGQAGAWLEQQWHGRGACRVDLDRDGKEDLVVSRIGQPAVLLLNRSVDAGNLLQLRLVGTQSNRNGEGATLRFNAATSTAVYPVSRNAGYLSSNGQFFTIGLGDMTTVDRMQIHWPGGEVQELVDLKVNSRITIVQGRRQLADHQVLER